MKDDFAKQFNSMSVISADDIKQWIIVASVNNAKLKEALENQRKVLVRINEDLMEIMAKCKLTVESFKIRIKRSWTPSLCHINRKLRPHQTVDSVAPMTIFEDVLKIVSPS